MRVLVTGSRHWHNREAMRKALERVGAKFTTDRLVLVHGDCKGADRMAAEIVAAWERWTVEAYPADWAGLGRGAGHARNQQMVDNGADVCLAFPTASSRGTWDCMKRANLAGVSVWIVPDRITEDGP